MGKGELMHYKPQCYSQKVHEPHTWGEFEPDSRAPFDCPGLKHGIRFIDKFQKLWVCVQPDQGLYDCSSTTPHDGCAYKWVANLDDEDMVRMAYAFDMSQADIKEFLGTDKD